MKKILLTTLLMMSCTEVLANISSPQTDDSIVAQGYLPVQWELRGNDQPIILDNSTKKNMMVVLNVTYSWTDRYVYKLAVTCKGKTYFLDALNKSYPPNGRYSSLLCEVKPGSRMIWYVNLDGGYPDASKGFKGVYNIFEIAEDVTTFK